MPKHDVCAPDDVPEGEVKAVKVGRSTIILTRLPDGEIRALNGRCPHQGADLAFGCVTGYCDAAADGVLEMARAGEILRCPWHGFEFDLRTGDPVVAAPKSHPLRLRFYDVAVEDGRVVVSW